MGLLKPQLILNSLLFTAVIFKFVPILIGITTYILISFGGQACLEYSRDSCNPYHFVLFVDAVSCALFLCVILC